MIKSGNIICSRQDKIYAPGHVKMSHESITFRILSSFQPKLNKSAGSMAYLVLNRLLNKLTYVYLFSGNVVLVYYYDKTINFTTVPYDQR